MIETNNPIDNKTPEYLRRINAALALHDVPDYPAALNQLEQAAAQAPTDWSVHLLLGITHQALQRPEQADNSFQAALKLDPQSAQVQQAYGSFLFEQGRLPEAAAMLKQLIEADIHAPKVWQLYATILRDLQQIEAALQTLQTAVAIWPEDVNFLNQLGHLLLVNDRPEEAKPILEQALALRPSTGSLCDLATVYTMAADYDQALDLLEQAAQRRPDNSRVWRGIAYCRLQQEQLTEAHAAAEKALTHDPAHFRSWQIMADVLLALGKHEEVLAVLEKGVRLANEAPDGQLVKEGLMARRAFVLAQTEGPEVALRQITQDLAQCRQSGQSSSPPSGLLQLQMELLKPLFAAKQYELILSTAQELESAKIVEAVPFIEQAGYGLYFHGQTGATESLFTAILRMVPNHPPCLNNLGFLLSGEEKWEEAADLLRQALATDFDAPHLAQVNLAYVYLRQGEYSEAVRLLTELSPRVQPDWEHVTRIACWHKGQFTPPLPAVFPLTAVPFDLVVWGNLAAAQFLAGNEEEGLRLAQEMIAVHPENYIGYAVAGCLQDTQGNSTVAGKLWRQGRAHIAGDDEEAMALFDQWLS